MKTKTPIIQKKGGAYGGIYRPQGGRIKKCVCPEGAPLHSGIGSGPLSGVLAFRGTVNRLRRGSAWVPKPKALALHKKPF
jgi:hypothetical protein